VVHVRGRGLVIVTGCGHARVVNIIRHAMRLTVVGRLLAVVGGLHLSGPAFEPVIGVAALTELAPELIVPSHCTGWRAQHALAAALPAAWVQASVGTSYTLGAWDGASMRPGWDRIKSGGTCGATHCRTTLSIPQTARRSRRD
jgi:7,8-dihydropterin-6-yl-methyl-4-(beta-D-ribofuranosyl)aminobenzene 5'-phosphate synthase